MYRTFGATRWDMIAGKGLFQPESIQFAEYRGQYWILVHSDYTDATPKNAQTSCPQANKRSNKKRSYESPRDDTFIIKQNS